MPNARPNISSQDGKQAAAPTNPYDVFASSSNDFYASYKKSINSFTAGKTAAQSVTKAEETDTDTGNSRFSETLQQILDEDKQKAIKLEDSETYKLALYPGPEYLAQFEGDQSKFETAIDQRITSVTTSFQKNYEDAQKKLEHHLTAEEEAFNRQLADYTRRAQLADPSLKPEEFEKNQRNAFKAYQQTQLNNLQTIYRKRENTFLNRINSAQSDLQRLRGIGLTGQELRDELTRPSKHGDGSNKRLNDLANRNYEYFATPVENLFSDASSLPDEPDRLKIAELQRKVLEPNTGLAKFALRSMALNRAVEKFKKQYGYNPIGHGEKLVNKLCYSLELKQDGDTLTAHVKFDTPSHQIAYKDRLSTWCNAADKLIEKGRSHYDLTWAKLSFPEASQEQIRKGIKKNKDGTFEQVPGLTVKRDMLGEPIKVGGKFQAAVQRYESVLDMTRHILGQNPNATIDPGHLPTAYQKRFNEMMKTENAMKIHVHARHKAGLTPNMPKQNGSEFKVNNLGQSKTDLSSVKSGNALDKKTSAITSFKKQTPPGSDLHKKSTDKDDLKDKPENISSVSFGRAGKV